LTVPATIPKVMLDYVSTSRFHWSTNDAELAQEHFIDLCRRLEEQTPVEVDPEGEWYCFERGAAKLALYQQSRH
jgi:hypothetical protein